MGKVAFVFSGQGAQYSGMGKSLYEASPAAKAVFDTAEQIRPGTIAQCFESPVEELSVTKNTQPCLFCVDLAAAEALREAGVAADAVAGFSLGEVAAVTFAGMFTAAEGFSLVVKRGEAMQAAAEKVDSAMAAILKLSNEKVEELCRMHQGVYPVNYNCPGQLVAACCKAELESFCSRVKEFKGKAVPLAVSGGFHSPFMDSAEQKLAAAMGQYHLHAPKIPIYANMTAQPYPQQDEACAPILTGQVTHPVQWEKTIRRMAEDGFDTFIEVGPGKTLSGLVKKIIKDAKIYRVEDKATLESTLEALRTPSEEE